MIQIINNLKIEFKQIFYKKMFWICYIGVLIYLLIPYNSFGPSKEFGWMLNSAGFAVASGMLLFIVFGFSLSTKENLTNCNELFKTISNSYRSKMYAKCISIILLSLSAALTSLLIVYLIYMINGANKQLYIMAFKYHILYWFFPFVLCGICGLIIGQVGNSKKSYVFIVLIWLLTSCTNKYIFIYITMFANRNLKDLIDFLTFSQTDIELSYNSLYGVPMEFKRWVHGLLLLVILIYIFYNITYKKSNKRTVKKYLINTSIFLGSIFILVVLYNRQGQIMYSNIQGDISKLYDVNYYYQRKDLNVGIPCYSIDSYYIDFKTTTNLAIKTQVDVNITKGTKEIVFTLYHDLHIRKLSVDNIDVKFNRDGDYVFIKFNSKVEKGSNIKISFEYDGNSSPLFYANDQAILLPSNFPWLPTNKDLNAMVYNDQGTVYVRDLSPNEEIKYTLKYSGNKKIFTNLDQQEESLWTGATPKGVTIVSGMLKQEKVSDVLVCYPVDVTYVKDNVINHIEYLTKTKTNIVNDLNLQIKKQNLKSVFYLPTPIENNFSQIYDFGDHIILNTIGNNNIYSNPLFSTLEVLKEVINTDSILEQDSYCVDLFMDAYAQWYSRKYSVQDLEYNRFWEMKMNSNKDKNVIKINDIIIKNNDAFLKQFFIKFLKLISENKEITEQDISSFLSNIGGM